MANCFIAGGELVRWDLIALGQDGPYRLAIHHAAGSIVEYFETVIAALLREKELEELLIAARAGADHRGSH
jgi:hypothetical protein